MKKMGTVLNFPSQPSQQGLKKRVLIFIDVGSKRVSEGTAEFDDANRLALAIGEKGLDELSEDYRITIRHPRSDVVFNFEFIE